MDRNSQQPDSVILNVTPLLCYFYSRHSKIGFASGIYFTPIGFRLENFTPDVFGFWLMLTTGIEWRTNNSHNNYINVFFRKYEIVKLQQTTYLSLYGEFKKLRVGPSEIKEYNISPDFSFKRLRLSLGYTLQKLSDFERNKKAHGLNFTIYAYLFDQVRVDLKTKYVLNNYQYGYKLFWDIPKPKITLGLGFERIGEFNEVSSSLQYRLSY